MLYWSVNAYPRTRPQSLIRWDTAPLARRSAARSPSLIFDSEMREKSTGFAARGVAIVATRVFFAADKRQTPPGLRSVDLLNDNKGLHGCCRCFFEHSFSFRDYGGIVAYLLE